MSAHPYSTPDHPLLPPVPACELVPDDWGNDLPPTPLARLPAGCWFSLLEEHLPNAYIHARATDLALLRADGATPAEAAAYARAFLFGPSLA